MENIIKNTAVQNLEQDAAQIEAKLQANRAALNSAKNAVHIATMNAAEEASADNMNALRAGKLEVDTLEAIRKELDRRAQYTGRELEKARVEAQRQHDERQLFADAAAHTKHKAQFFETGEQIAQALALLPDFCADLETLRRSTIDLENRAQALDMGDIADVRAINGDQYTLLRKAGDTITGDLLYLRHFVGQILGAILQAQGEAATAHLTVQAIENARTMFTSIREQTEEEREAEAASLEAYYRGERTREATLAFNNEQRRTAQKANDAKIAQIVEKTSLPTATPAPKDKPQHASLSLSQRLHKAA